MGKRALTVSALICGLLAAGTIAAHAQAWTPQARTLGLDGSYQLGYATRTENVDISVIHHLFVPTVEYGITDELAVSASLPFFMGQCPDCPTLDGGTHAHGSYDDGSYHATPTDFRLTARYMIPVSFVSITPQIGGSIPVRSYEWAGNAAAGRRLKAAYLGLNLGADLDDYIPRTTVHLAYEFALVEKFKQAGPEGEALNQNYITFAAQIGHSIGPFHLNAALDLHYGLGGIAFSDFPMLTDLERKNHDPILLETIWLAGGGVGYDLGDHTSLYAAVRIFVSGENTSNASTFGLGASWDVDL